MTLAEQHWQPTADVSLVARMARGDRAALVELMARYRTTAYAVAYAMLVDPEAADSVVREAFDNLWRGAERFDPSRASVRGGLTDLIRLLAQRRLQAHTGNQSSR